MHRGENYGHEVFGAGGGLLHAVERGLRLRLAARGAQALQLFDLSLAHRRIDAHDFDIRFRIGLEAVDAHDYAALRAGGAVAAARRLGLDFNIALELR